MARSSRGPGHRPLTPVTRVRIPYALPSWPLSPKQEVIATQNGGLAVDFEPVGRDHDLAQPRSDGEPLLRPGESMTEAVDRHQWVFKARFRRSAFGRRSQPAIQRVKEAVAEIKEIRRKDAALAAEGAIVFFERISPALEHVDSSSGAIGTAVNRAIANWFRSWRPLR